MKKKTLYLYLFREILSPFCLGLFILIFVLLLGRMSKLIELVVGKGVEAGEAAKLFLYLLPFILGLTIPIALLLAILLAFGRLSSDSELIALRASGLSFYQFMPPVFVLSIFAYILTMLLSIYAVPWGNSSFKDQLLRILKTRAISGMQEGVFNDSIEGLVIYVHRIEEQKMKGVLVFDKRGSFSSRDFSDSTTFAQEGAFIYDQISGTLDLRLVNGEIHQISRDLRRYRRLSFQSYDLRLLGDEFKKPREYFDMSITELKGCIKSLKGEGRDYGIPLVVLHERFAVPFACIIFCILGVPLGIRHPRSGRSWGLVFGLGVVLLYYVLLMGGEALGKRGVIPPFIAIWSVDILFLTLAFILFIRAAKERHGRYL